MSAITGSGIQSFPVNGTVVRNIFTVPLTTAVGTVTALTGSIFTATVTGLLITDTVFVSCQGALTAGAAIGNARVPTNGVIELDMVTAVALGAVVPSLTYSITVIR